MLCSMPNQSVCSNDYPFVTTFSASQPWDAPDPLPVMRREMKLLLLEIGQSLLGGAAAGESHRLYNVDISSKNLRHHWNACSRTSAAGVSDLPSVIHSSAACAV